MAHGVSKLGCMSRKPKRISEFDRKLGIAVRNRRTDPEYGMSQSELSKRAGIPLSNYQRREDGENEITVSELERIAYHLQTTPFELVKEALSRYGDVEKLIAEYGPQDAVSDVASTVDAADNVTYLGHVTPGLKDAADDKDRSPSRD